MTIPAEPPSRRLKPTLRSFMATTSELEDVVGVLRMARQLIDSEIAAEMTKLEKKRVSSAAIQKMRDQAAMLDRVIREMTA